MDDQQRIQLVLGDITALEVQAIVTAANAALCGGGGVDGAVHSAAGPELVEASMALAPCPAGSARITSGFNLKSRYVVHAVGPVFENLESDSEVLESAYTASLALATQHEVSSIAFPCISTGAFGFPHREACEIAVDSIVSWLQESDRPESVIFCCYEHRDFVEYKSRLEELGILP